MLINKEHLAQAADKDIIPRSKIDELWSFLEAATDEPLKDSDTATFFWYAGIALSFLALLAFSQKLVETYTGLGLSAAALMCATAFAIMASIIRTKPGLQILFGVLVTGMVLMVPIFVVGLQISDLLDASSVTNKGEPYLLEPIKDNPYYPAMATIIAGSLALRFSSFLFIVVPITLAVWLIVAKFLIGELGGAWRDVALLLAVLTIVVVWIVDLRSKWNFGFWMHKCTMLLIAAPVGSFFLEADEAYKRLAVFICVLVIAICLYLRRPSGVYWGTVGIYGYVSHVVFDLLHNPVSASFVLVIIGIGMVLIGWRIQNFLHRHPSESRFGARFRPRARTGPITFGAG